MTRPKSVEREQRVGDKVRDSPKARPSWPRDLKRPSAFPDSCFLLGVDGANLEMEEAEGVHSREAREVRELTTDAETKAKPVPDPINIAKGKVVEGNAVEAT
jgi:hypothetical protein